MRNFFIVETWIATLSIFPLYIHSVGVKEGNREEDRGREKETQRRKRVKSVREKEKGIDREIEEKGGKRLTATNRERRIKREKRIRETDKNKERKKRCEVKGQWERKREEWEKRKEGKIKNKKGKS